MIVIAGPVASIGVELILKMVIWGVCGGKAAAHTPIPSNYVNPIMFELRARSGAQLEEE